jgi:hypothetical protein
MSEQRRQRQQERELQKLVEEMNHRNKMQQRYAMRPIALAIRSLFR